MAMVRSGLAFRADIGSGSVRSRSTRVAVTRIILVLLSILAAGSPALAGPRAQCRHQCDAAVAECVASTGSRLGVCRRRTLRRCRREGLQVCVPATTTTTNTSTTTSHLLTTTSTTLVSACLTDSGDGTILDTCTGLQWEKKTT